MLWLVAALCPPVSALNPSLDISQYAHTAWTIRDGFFKGTIYSIAQTPDGYLWLGTEFGLFRFDGVRPVAWTPPDGEHLPNPLVNRLLVARDGTLWIGTLSGLASWNGARLTRYPELDGPAVASLLEDRDGTVWASSFDVAAGRLCAIRKGATECYGADGSFGRMVLSLVEDRAGNFWVGAETGLWRQRPAPPQLYAVPHPNAGLEIRDLNSTEHGQVLMATNGGMKQFSQGRVQPYSIPGVPDLTSPQRLLRDRNGGLWIGTADRGLVHIHQGRTDVFSRSEGLSGDFISSLFEDREGNVWVSTNEGLDRFREFSIASLTVKQGLSNDSVWSVLAATDGSVWFGSRGGLNKWLDGRVTTVARDSALPNNLLQSLFQDDRGGIWLFSGHGLTLFEDGSFTQIRDVPGGQVHSIAGDSAGNLWLAHDKGLLHLSDGRIVEQIPWSRLSHKQPAETLAADSRLGGLWIGFGYRDGGVAYLENGQIRKSYATTNGLGAGAVSDLRLDRDGTLWAATEGGLSIIKNGRVTTLSGKNGLCDSVYWILEDDDHGVWLYTACGLMRVARAELDALAAEPNRTIQPTVFDTADGVKLNAISPSSFSPRVARAPDGRLWFVTGAGVSVIDPRHFSFNNLPPPVHIAQIIDDHKVVSNLRLPPLSHDLEIDYTTLSFVAPEKNRFKYKLEGYDRDWQDAGNRRQAFYTNLPPRQYRFRVIASNNSGVWNETGDTLEFSIAPAYYQTTWFYASCVAAFLAMLWGLYRLRLYQVRREFNAQLDGRVDERLRVARELHDTLLQSFQASLIRMQAARNVFARRPEKAVESLDAAITMAAGAVAEGRSAIQNLRLHPASGGDLAQLLTAAGQELTHSEEAQGNPPVFRLTVEGELRDLEPLLQDEVYRIARELLRNAFRHAQAGRIEAEIRYESRQLRVHIRDDGKGIDPEVLKAGGRAGHYGLPGMRERADRFGGKLEFWSEAGAGTEAVLTVPAAAAYGASNGGPFSFFRRKKAGS